MQKTIELEDLLPAKDWQRLETWAAMAGITPLDYLRNCVYRGHEILREELKADAPISMRPEFNSSESHERKR